MSADYAAACRWMMDRLDLIADDEEGVWLSQGLGKVLRPPAEVAAVFRELHNDGSRRAPGPEDGPE